MCGWQGGVKGTDKYQEAFSFSKIEKPLSHHKLSLISIIWYQISKNNKTEKEKKKDKMRVRKKCPRAENTL